MKKSIFYLYLYLLLASMLCVFVSMFLMDVVLFSAGLLFVCGSSILVVDSQSTNK